MILFIPLFICGFLCLKILFRVQSLYYQIPKDSARRKVRLFVDILLALPIFLYPLTLIADIMMFDRPGSETNPQVWLWYILLVFYPLLLMLLIWLVTKRCNRISK